MAAVMQGLAYGLTMTQSRGIEESVRAGENGYLTAAMQVVQGIQTIFFAGAALQVAGKSQRTGAITVLATLTPVAINLAKKYNLVSEQLRPALNFVQTHMSKLFEIASIVSCVALIYFGHVVLGLTSLIVLALGIMDRKGILPENIRQCIHRYTEPLLTITGLFSGGFINQLFAAFNLALWGARKYTDYKKIQTPQEAIPEDNLNALKAVMHVHGDLPFAVNPKHIHCNPLPPIPEIDIEVIVQQCDEMNWAHHMEALREKFRRDPRFIEQHRNPDLKTEVELVTLLKDSLRRFIRSVQEHRILEGEPIDYIKLHNYLKVVAKYLQDQRDPITKADVLMRLGIEGGEYCGPGKFEVTEGVFAQSVSENPALSLRDKVLHCLQDERNRWMQAFYKKVMENNLLAHLADWLDIHMYNIFINCYGDRFGLRKTAAENDDSAIVEPLFKFMLTMVTEKGLDRLFWADHQQEDLIHTLLPAIGTPQLPKPDIIAYLLKWITRQEDMTIDEKGKFVEDLADGYFLEEPLENQQGRFNPNILALMLFDMGILQDRGTIRPDENVLMAGLLDRPLIRV